MSVSPFSAARTVAALCLFTIACNSHVVATDENPGDLGAPGGGTTDLAGSVADLAGPPPDLRSGPDLAGKPPLASCTGDDECASGACKAVGDNGGSICVPPCHSQADCAALPGGLFCEPKTAGATDGYCIPPSPFHCAMCGKDSDCGVLAESCTLAPGDIAAACHIDCSLSTAACPSDYDCVSVTESGPGPTAMRMLCVPKLAVCLDSLGGFCDRVALPQPCQRDNDAGSCNGQRPCLAGGRYDRCGAMAPQYKQCGDMDPPGCMEALAPGATGSKENCGMCGHACADTEDCCGGVCKPLNTVSDCGSCGNACAGGSGCCGSSCTPLNTVANCGACGNICPGQGLASDDVFCDSTSHTCGMTCRGDNYDIDNNAGNGCEVLDVVPPGHTQSTAASRGSKDCYDTDSHDTYSSGVPSDKRVHTNPPVDSFNGSVGAAPDWWTVHGDGGTFCEDDYDITFSTSGGSTSSCYMLTFITNKTTDSVTINGAGSGSISGGSGSYSDDSDIYFKIEKTCSSPGPENVNYTVDYHL